MQCNLTNRFANVFVQGFNVSYLDRVFLYPVYPCDKNLFVFFVCVFLCFVFWINYLLPESKENSS